MARDPVPISEGSISFDAFETRYRIVGDLARSPAHKPPILALHGGPGLPHGSLEPLEDLARDGRPVVFYDQLGCGDSVRPDSVGWGVGLFLRELSAVRRGLGLSRVHLLGHSWGGMLAMEHALEGAEGLESLILIGATASGETMLENRQDFYDGLPTDTR